MKSTSISPDNKKGEGEESWKYKCFHDILLDLKFSVVQLTELSKVRSRGGWCVIERCEKNLGRLPLYFYIESYAVCETILLDKNIPRSFRNIVHQIAQFSIKLFIYRARRNNILKIIETNCSCRLGIKVTIF